MAETTTRPPTKKAATKTAVVGAKPAAKKPAVAVSTAKPVAKKPVAKVAAVASPKPAAKKPAPATAKKTVATKPAAKSAVKGMVVSDAQRYRMIAEAAYYRAESNQFKSDSVRDWIEAEGDIAALLSGVK